MAEVVGEFLMNFNQFPRFVVDFLPKANCILVRIDFLEVACAPTALPGDR